MTKARTGRDGWRDGKGQIGIDGNRDADFGKMRRGNDPWTVEPRSVDFVPGDGPWGDGPWGDGIKRSDRLDSRGRGAYVDETRILRDTGTDPENYAKIDIFDMVEGQAAKTGPVVLRKRDR